MYIRGAVIRFLIYWFAVGLIIGLSFLVPFLEDLALTIPKGDVEWFLPDETYENRYRPINLPILYGDEFRNYKYLINFHAHTYASGDSSLPVRDSLLSHIAVGFDVVVISDHQSTEGAFEAVKLSKTPEFLGKITVIPGQEFTTCRGHLLLVGINKHIDAPDPFPTMEQYKNIINQVHSQGGVVVLAHYNRQTVFDKPDMKEWLDAGVDYIEIAYGSSPPNYNLIDIARKNNVGITADLDTHGAGPTTRTWTVLHPSTINNTYEEIMKTLRGGRWNSTQHATSYIYQETKAPTLPFKYENEDGGKRINSPISRFFSTPFHVIHNAILNLYPEEREEAFWNNTDGDIVWCEPRKSIDVVGLLSYVFWTLLIYVTLEIYCMMKYKRKHTYDKNHEEIDEEIDEEDTSSFDTLEITSSESYE
jgi:histidinol phosphatase-like PHP family hydrolase